MKKILGVSLLIALVGLLFAFVFPNTDGQQARQAAQDVLDNVIAKDFDEAAEHVYFYDKASDLEPTITQEKGKSLWIERIEDWEASGASLVDFENLQIKKDDGALRSYVDLTFDVNGEKMVKEGVHLMFAEPNGEWKLQYLEHLADDAAEEWEVTLSGHIPSE